MKMNDDREAHSPRVWARVSLIGYKGDSQRSFPARVGTRLGNRLCSMANTFIPRACGYETKYSRMKFNDELD